MTENEVLQILHDYFASLFPKVCPNCNRTFATLLDYIRVTNRVGKPVSYDSNGNYWQTTEPIGTAVHANCPCGSTLSLTTENMELVQRLELLNWVKKETRRRGVNTSELLEYLRNVIRSRVLGDLIQTAENPISGSE
jgi:hypothetical protein